mgnify:CR=1 FL=1
MKIFNAVNNLLFPPHCIFCDCITDFRNEYHICDKCREAVTPLMGNRCKVCLRETRGNFGTDLCAACRTKMPYFDRLRSCYEYNKYVRNCVLRLKFHQRYDHARTMGMLMTNLIEEGSADYIIPVPVSKERLRERGYNQSVLFSKEISAGTKIPMRTDLLFKIKDTKPQSSLKFNERTENVKNSYKAASGELLKGKRIILTDDVATTRSTINECAKVLKKAGAKSVECVTFAVAVEHT